ncbi:MFS transporter [Pseudarthrobacter sp. H2]|uniref:MFS transporter n=1 Tax=Pseudarthrobacter sp. H2 TaxID=3418415 RepID=UPI003CF78284
MSEPSTLTQQEATPAGSMNTKDMRRILASSFIGSAIEYYDFILYATAASIVFNKVFFANLEPGVAIFASFATLAVGYLSRPLGGIIFGHFGDTIGRKRMLVLSMLLMGGATTAIGVLPTTAQIGVAAPVALIVMRLIQGFAVGGEWGGAALMAMEHAPQKRRGFAASFANAGGPAGAILATLTVSAVTAISGKDFLVWGWRVPFLLSLVLIAVGMIIRLKVSETPMFKKLEEPGAKKRIPLVEVFRHHSRAVVIALVATMSFYCCQGILTVWGVSIAVENGVDQASVLNIKALGAVATLIVTVYSARLSDKLGRRPILIGAGIAGIVLAYPLLWCLNNGTVWGFATAILVGQGIIQGLLFGPIGAYIAEQFPTDMRYTGASLSYQGASVLGAGFTPMIAAALMLAGGGTLWLVGGFWIAVLLAGVIAVKLTPEGIKRKLA